MANLSLRVKLITFIALSLLLLGESCPVVEVLCELDDAKIVTSPTCETLRKSKEAVSAKIGYLSVDGNRCCLAQGSNSYDVDEQSRVMVPRGESVCTKQSIPSSIYWKKVLFVIGKDFPAEDKAMMAHLMARFPNTNYATFQEWGNKGPKAKLKSKEEKEPEIIIFMSHGLMDANQNTLVTNGVEDKSWTISMADVAKAHPDKLIISLNCNQNRKKASSDRSPGYFTANNHVKNGVYRSHSFTLADLSKHDPVPVKNLIQNNPGLSFTNKRALLVVTEFFLTEDKDLLLANIIRESNAKGCIPKNSVNYKFVKSVFDRDFDYAEC